MKDLILFLAKSLVENPDAVQVTETEGPDSIILELNVAPCLLYTSISLR